MKGHIDYFIQTMEDRSNSASSYGYKVIYLELRDLARKHQKTYGETHVEEFIHLLDELGNHPDMHPKARPIVKLHAEALQRRAFPTSLPVGVQAERLFYRGQRVLWADAAAIDLAIGEVSRDTDCSPMAKDQAIEMLRTYHKNNQPLG